MTQNQIEQIINMTIDGIIKYEKIWHETGDEEARENARELRFIQSRYMERYVAMKLKKGV